MRCVVVNCWSNNIYLSSQLILQQSWRSTPCLWPCRWTLLLARWAGGSREASLRSPSCSASSPTRPRPPRPPASSSRGWILQNTDDGSRSGAVQGLSVRTRHRHQQESRISRNLEKYWPRSLPLARKNWIFILFLFSIFKILKKKFSFSSRFMRIWNINLVLFSI